MVVVVKTQDALECTGMKQEDVVEVVAGAMVVKRQDALQYTRLKRIEEIRCVVLWLKARG